MELKRYFRNPTIIDLYDRSVVASETGKWITSDLANSTLEKALNSQRKKPENLILHSDQFLLYNLGITFSFRFRYYRVERDGINY